jgi:hypothetical protein
LSVAPAPLAVPVATFSAVALDPLLISSRELSVIEPAVAVPPAPSPVAFPVISALVAFDNPIPPLAPPAPAVTLIEPEVITSDPPAAPGVTLAAPVTNCPVPLTPVAALTVTPPDTALSAPLVPVTVTAPVLTVLSICTAPPLDVSVIPPLATPLVLEPVVAIALLTVSNPADVALTLLPVRFAPTVSPPPEFSVQVSSVVLVAATVSNVVPVVRTSTVCALPAAVTTAPRLNGAALVTYTFPPVCEVVTPNTP